MSLSLPSRQVFFSSSPPVHRGGPLCFAIATVTPSLRKPRLLPQPIIVRHVSATVSFLAHASSPGSYESSTEPGSSFSDGFDFDSFLSFAESLCILSSAAISLAFAVKYTIVGEIRRRVLAWGFVGLVGAVATGSWLRRRQWRRICRGMGEGERSNLIPRIEKLEDDVRSTATIVRVLSRQLEKLGIRFRITRKALKEPITETAALVQKNAEAARVLAAQEDILEKELGEIQKVLLAMQEQQRKQLQLILAVTKNGNLLESSGKIVSDEQRDKADECFHNSPPDVVVNKDNLNKAVPGSNTGNGNL